MLPGAVLAATLAAWEAFVALSGTPAYVLPAPSRVLRTLAADWPVLAPALGVTLRLTLAGFASAAAGGVLMGVALTRSRWAELAFSPYAVILQVTPLVAIAPILVIYAGVTATVYLSVFLVAFFPVLAATMAGLRAADPALSDLFRLYRATPAQRLFQLELPSAAPFIAAGVRTAGGLSLIGAVVAEFVAGAGGAGSGLAYRIVEASYRLNVPRLFASVLLICVAGLLIYAIVSVACAALVRRWRPQGG
nr:ABC transporter permease subunit [Alsobacter ponti]